jgi:hypothetical protein
MEQAKADLEAFDEVQQAKKLAKEIEENKLAEPVEEEQCKDALPKKWVEHARVDEVPLSGTKHKTVRFALDNEVNEDEELEAAQNSTTPGAQERK